MKAVTILSLFLAAVSAADLFPRAGSCECDIAKCPSSGDAHCKCVTGTLDACYVKQTKAGIDCGAPVYPDGCSSSTPIQKKACDSTNDKCGSSEICYFPDKSCDPHTAKCTGLCASDFCGGRWQKECADSRWSCVYEDACLQSGADDCDGKCVLN